MNTCDTCRFWTEHPGLSFYKRPFNHTCECPKLTGCSHILPDEELHAETDEGNVGTSVETGPKFGCIHHQAVITETLDPDKARWKIVPSTDQNDLTDGELIGLSVLAANSPSPDPESVYVRAWKKIQPAVHIAIER